jgi:hypothetical protein
MNTSLKMTPKLAVAFAALGLCLGACLKTEKFPVEPHIMMKEFKQFGDSTSLVISFTDGDGDIGLGQNDVNPPFDTASIYYFNLFCDMSRRQNNSWVPVTQLPYYYRVPSITPTGQNKALNGDIAVALKPFPLPPVLLGDTVRFNVKLVDRALHQSNTVTTEAIRLH